MPVERTAAQIHDRLDADVVLSDRVQDAIREFAYEFPTYARTHFRSGFWKRKDLLNRVLCFVKECSSQTWSHMLIVLRSIV
jgi:hypothetical protein